MPDSKTSERHTYDLGAGSRSFLPVKGQFKQRHREGEARTVDKDRVIVDNTNEWRSVRTAGFELALKR